MKAAPDQRPASMRFPTKLQHAGVLTVALVLCLAVEGRAYRQVDSQLTDNPEVYLEYEWHADEVLYQYAQASSFTLLAFNVPVRTQSAEFQIDLTDDSTDGVSRNVIVVLLPGGGIPFINPYNESLPGDFVLSAYEQQTLIVPSKMNRSFSMNISPLPGRVYMAASLLNPLSSVVSFLQWGQPLSQARFNVSVKAIYTIRTAVTSLPVDRISSIALEAHESRTQSFTLPALATSYSIVISQCNATTSNTSGTCPITIAASETLSPDSFTTRVDCGQQKLSECVVTVISPLAGHEHYVIVSMDDEAGVQSVTFHLRFDIDVCQSAASIYPRGNSSDAMLVDTTSVAIHSSVTNESDAGLIMQVLDGEYSNVSQFPNCVSLGPLGRENAPVDIYSFAAVFGGWNLKGQLVPKVHVIANDEFMVVKTFRLQNGVDTGGVLGVHATLMSQNWTGVVWLCASPQRVPENGSVYNSCSGGRIAVHSPANLTGHVFMLFPAPGTWHLALQSQCYADGTRRVIPCENLPLVKFSVAMTQCPDECRKVGKCEMYMAATSVYAACECYAGHRGLTCSDTQYALTPTTQLTAVLLLTLSNLAFVPTIVLAAYRRLFTLAAIFFFNLFFSSFYHACDASRLYQLCIMDYDTLAFSDFFGSVMSFYAVLAFMARMPEKARTFLLLSGAMVIAMFQDNNRHNDLFHVLPLVFIGIIMLGSWIREMKQRRAIFPSKKRYLYFILPGMLLACLGIGINYGLMHRADSYQYSHSFWHFSVMLAPCFLMPPGPLKGRVCADSRSAQQIIRVIGGVNSQPRQQWNNNESDPLIVPEMMDAAVEHSLTTGQSPTQR